MHTPFQSKGKARVAVDFHNYTVMATTESTPFPGSNISILASPHRVWRSGVSEVLDDPTQPLPEQTLTLTLHDSTNTPLTTPQPIPALYIDNTNFPQLRIELVTLDNPMAEADYSITIDIPRDPRLRRRKTLVTFENASATYVRLVVPSQHTDNGAGYYTIGTVAIPLALTEMTENIEYPLEWNVRLPHMENEFMTGAKERIRLTDSPQLRVVLSVIRSNDERAVAEVYEMFGDPTRTILFDARLSAPWESYLCRAQDGIAESWGAWNPRDFGRVELVVV